MDSTNGKIPRNSLSAIAAFRMAIALSKKDSVAGLSGFSYNMPKIAPLPVITAICLCALWVNKKVPEHHKWRWLLPIPKITSPELTDLRPLSLVKVTQKLWASLLMSKVSHKWVVHNSVLAKALWTPLSGMQCLTSSLIHFAQ